MWMLFIDQLLLKNNKNSTKIKIIKTIDIQYIVLYNKVENKMEI